MDIEIDNIKLMFGDCLERLRELPDDSIDLILTDPPYDIKNTKAGGSNSLCSRLNNSMSELEDLNIVKGFDILVLDELVRVCKNINILLFCNKSQLPMYIDYFVTRLGCSFDLIKWVKTNPPPTFNNKYLSDTEYCFYARKKGYCNPDNYKNASTLYHAPINIKDKRKFNHPTIKPLPLIERLIRNSSKINSVILDPFMGSGTTGLAALNLNRKFIGIELDPTYYGVSCERILTSATS